MENVDLLQNKYDSLVAKVKLMLDTQQAYFRSGKDKNLLMKSKAIESQVRKMINPEESKKKQQQELFDNWLAQ
ncbi:MAG TPA: hypothetical protein VN722_08325 [Hanamia sp.]|nr:hypothetical protein [Hanamia sp.]